MSNKVESDLPYFDSEKKVYLPSNALDLILKEQSLEEEYARLEATAQSYINDQDPQYE